MTKQKQQEQVEQEQEQAKPLSVAEIKDKIADKRAKIKELEGHIEALEKQGIEAAEALLAEIGGYEVRRIGEKKEAGKKQDGGGRLERGAIKEWLTEILRKHKNGIPWKDLWGEFKKAFPGKQQASITAYLKGDKAIATKDAKGLVKLKG